MIAGLLLRNFKTYKGISFIPFLEKDYEYLQVFIGDNGAGKSSILEGLNAYFNNGKWIQTTGQKESYVAPLFLLEREKYSRKFAPKTLEMIQNLSAFFWELPIEGRTKYNQTQEALINYIEKLKPFYEKTHFCLLLGNYNEDRINLHFATFEKDVKSKVLGFEWDENLNEIRKRSDQNTINKIMLELDELLSFIYISADADISQLLKLESEWMQELVNREIKEDIEGILKQPYSKDSTESILGYINKKLLPYIEDVEKTIQRIDTTYKFKGDRFTKLSSRDLIDPIIEVFYTKRRLEKNNKPIDDLSAGERKKALVDIVYSFLSQQAETEKEIIFAIDEPESSLDAGNRYESFERIEKIANQYKRQTFITTHWFGLLPIIHKGMIHCIELKGGDDVKPEVKKYDARFFISARKSEADDNYFKSYSDLSNSIYSSLRAKPIHWLIVEGVDDKNYLEYYLNNLIEGFADRFRVLAVGGSGNVKILFEHLFIPIDNSQEEMLKGITLCLSDTDEAVEKTNFTSKTGNKKLLIQRLQYIKEEIKLLNFDSPDYSQKTVVEDALEPRKFYDALNSVIINSGNSELIAAFQNHRYNNSSKTSRISGDQSILTPIPAKNGKEGDPSKDKQLILNFIKELTTKEKLSIEYCKQKFDRNSVPGWIIKYLLPVFFGNNIPFIKNEQESVAVTVQKDAK